MKRLFAIISVFISVTAAAQTQTALPDKKAGEMIIYIDSIKINMDTYFKYMDKSWFTDGVQIKHIKEPDYGIRFPNKNPVQLRKILSSPLLSLDDICKERLSATERKEFKLFQLDSKLLTDTTGIRIPKMCINKVELTQLPETPYFKNQLLNSVLVVISTKPVTPNTGPIYIRGLAANEK